MIHDISYRSLLGQLYGMAGVQGGASRHDVLGHHARKLTEKERDSLDKDSVLVCDFKRKKLEHEAKKNWDLFYKRNSTHFFKDRHWITREFSELFQTLSEPENVSEGCGGVIEDTGRVRVCLEAGCGVGNTVFPLMEENKHMFVYACDFSPRAIDLLKVIV